MYNVAATWACFTSQQESELTEANHEGTIVGCWVPSHLAFSSDINSKGCGSRRHAPFKKLHVFATWCVNIKSGWCRSAAWKHAEVSRSFRKLRQTRTAPRFDPLTGAGASSGARGELLTRTRRSRERTRLRTSDSPWVALRSLFLVHWRQADTWRVAPSPRGSSLESHPGGESSLRRGKAPTRGGTESVRRDEGERLGIICPTVRVGSRKPLRSCRVARAASAGAEFEGRLGCLWVSGV